MTQWLRWYRGSVEDAKFRFIAYQAKVSISEAIAVWAVLLEDAASDQHRGIVTRDINWITTILALDAGFAAAILTAMQSLSMVKVTNEGIIICNWGLRQFESDADKTAAERKKRQRERQSRSSHGPVTRDTSVSHGSVTRTETETETYKEEKSQKKKSRAARSTTQRGQRWPNDAIVPEPWLLDGEMARSKNGLPQIDLKVEAEAFANYWAAKSGAGAAKMDWRRTWINWVLNSKIKGTRNGSGQTQLEQLMQIACDDADRGFD